METLLVCITTVVVAKILGEAVKNLRINITHTQEVPATVAPTQYVDEELQSSLDNVVRSMQEAMGVYDESRDA